MSQKKLAIPGFVDLQVNGFKGVDFSSPALEPEAFAGACRELLREGTAAFLPTIITSAPETYRRNLALMAGVMRRAEFDGRLPGLHVEGPFISSLPGAVGAHNPAWVHEPDPALLEDMQNWAGGRIRLLTLAPEVAGADALARRAVAMGIAVSLGHTLATPDDLRRLAAAGAIGITHLGNGLPNQLPRHNNPIWAGLAEDALTAMIIADGHHLPDPVLKVMIRAKGVDRTVVVSDASPLAGMPPGRYTTLGNLAVLEPSGLLHNPEKQCLVGSSATMLRCMNHLAALGFLSLDELLALGFRNPLRLIGVDPGSIPAVTTLRYDAEGRMFSAAAG